MDTPTGTHGKATSAMRRYAAEIFRLQEDRPYVSLSDLANQVDSSLQAVSRMISRLKESGYLEHEPYRGVRLTESGRQIALPAIRRHRLVEVFLVRVMEFGWHEVHDYSDRFELGVNQRIEDRIYELCGHPTRCPHGEPIPSREGVMPEVHDASLVEMQTGKEYLVSRVRVHEPEKLRYLGELGLYPQTRLGLVGFGPFQGPVRIRLNRQELILSHELAAALFVEPAGP
ncbi:MAG: metal-dependent transcriptional regulator [Anaerolineaceae bacterium]|nr:metal-dependent transcriptional regulator [Anaerolineaceae bacterium]